MSMIIHNQLVVFRVINSTPLQAEHRFVFLDTFHNTYCIYLKNLTFPVAHGEKSMQRKDDFDDAEHFRNGGKFRGSM